MGSISDHAALPIDAPAVAEPEPGRIPARQSLRVVMVVANDVTRDSRVLREAGALAAVGHHVTVLGIMTARTTAPAVEVRDGFVVRRLPYRARPPRWWVPPDFYARIRYRASRQYRIHRARAVALWRRGMRSARMANTRPRALEYRRDRFRSVLRRRMDRLTLRTRPRWTARRSRLSGGVAGPNRVPVRNWRRWWSARRLVVHGYVTRARRTPLPQWPGKTARAVERIGGASSRSISRLMRRLVAAPGVGRVAPAVPASDASHSTRVRRLNVVFVARVLVSVAAAKASAAGRLPIRAGAAASRGVRAWAAIVSLLAWGSLYILANRSSRGAVEWMTGWRWRWFGWAEYLVEHAPDADVWHGHDMTSLPAVVALKRRRGGIAVYDSHEIYFESGRHAIQPRWAKRPLEKLERRLSADVDAVVTVNRSLATILSERLERADIHVLYNCPARPTQPLRGSPLRRALGLDRSVPLLLYHGSLAPHRGVDELLSAIRRPELDGVHLAFLGFGPLFEQLRTEARAESFGGRVHVLEAVRPDELPAWLAGVDVAVAPIQASTLNHRNSSPNKVFEAISSGTPVAGSDFPEFRRVIEDPTFGPLGTLFDPSRPEDIAAAVRRILDLPPAERTALRRRCRLAASMRWNWETESRALLGLYDRFASVSVPVRPRLLEAGAA